MPIKAPSTAIISNRSRSRSLSRRSNTSPQDCRQRTRIRLSAFRPDGAEPLCLFLEPISKSSEEENKAGELDESKEVLGVVFPADENAALPLDPRKEAFDEPAAHIAG